MKTRKSWKILSGFTVMVKVIESYSDSCLGWMENLGVAPSFSLRRFLLRPTFFFFLNLLFFVTRLLETIKNLFLNFLQYIGLFVKILFFFFSLGLHASIPQVVVLSTGEVLEIKTEDTAKYTITRRNIVGHKFFPQQKKMILKGKKRGISKSFSGKNRDNPTNSPFLFNREKSNFPMQNFFLP